MTMHPVKISNLLVDDWLTDLAAASPYVALMIADPYTVADPLTVELSGANRAAVTWDVQSRFLVPESDLVFVGVPAEATILALAGFSAAFNGDLAWGLICDPFTLSTYGAVTIAAADVKVGFGSLL